MISLVKGVIPNILAVNAAAWTAAVLNKLAAGLVPTDTEKRRYNHADVKAALLEETNQKCAYCESKLLHITYGDIEHVVPKSIVPVVWFDWNNLTIACDVCNTNKGEFIGDHTSFVDPYQVDPEVHFWFMGEFIWPRPGSDPGIITERVIDLNRGDLVERRMTRLRGLMRLLENIVRAQNPVTKQILQTDFLEETKSNKEYAALARYVHKKAQEDGILLP